MKHGPNGRKSLTGFISNGVGYIVVGLNSSDCFYFSLQTDRLAAKSNACEQRPRL